MGVFTNLASSTQFGPKPRIGLDRASAQQLLARASRIDPDIASAYAAGDEVTTIPEQVNADVGDTYILTFTFYGDKSENDPISTAAIAFDAAAATIESAIDTAFAAFPSWTNGDISVVDAGAAGVSDGAVTLTFDGASVTETPVVVTIAATGFTADENITRVAGGGDREALMALFEMNVVSGTVHNGGEEPSDWVRPESTGQSRPRYDLIRGLAVLASQEDGTDHVYNTVKALYPGI